MNNIDKNQVKQDFERYAKNKKFNYNVSEVFIKHFNKCLEECGKNKSEIKILDFGCGDGKYFPFLISMGLKKDNIYGAEVSKIRAERCLKLGWENISQIRDGKKLPINDNSIDIVMFMEVIEHIPSTEIRSCLTEITRVLKPSGALIVTTPNYPIKRFYDIYDAIVWGKKDRLKDDPTHVTFYKEKKIRKLLELYFNKFEIFPYKNGFLYNRIKKKFFIHKLIAICSIKK